MQQELSQCTFKPKICEHSKVLVESRKMRQVQQKSRVCSKGDSNIVEVPHKSKELIMIIVVAAKERLSNFLL